jgi:hypothetical protein
MPLTMRSTGLGSGFYKDNADYGIFCGERCIGRIYQTPKLMLPMMKRAGFPPRCFF